MPNRPVAIITGGSSGMGRSGVELFSASGCQSIIADINENEGNKIKEWLEACNQENIYHLCHFTIGLNPEAGISGNLVEDERKVAAVDFGFGYQSSDLGGTVGPCDYHMDVVISSPSIFLDGKEMSGRGKFNPKMGFKNMVKPRSH